MAVVTITKAVEKKGPRATFWIVSTIQNPDTEYLCFDAKVTGMVGKETDVYIYESNGKSYMKFEFPKGHVVKEIPEQAKKPDRSDINKGTTLSYAKDILIAIAIAEMNRRPEEYTGDMAYRFVREQLPLLHDEILSLLS
jgi:hypothetical protein